MTPADISVVIPDTQRRGLAIRGAAIDSALVGRRLGDVIVVRRRQP